MAFGKHERPNRGATDVWLTPRSIIDLLGPFDLDPCAATNPPWQTAQIMLNEQQDGLTYAWRGLVWLNPPYSEVGKWMTRLADHGEGVALIFARTETAWFHSTVWQRASSVAFPRGRLTFCDGAGRRAKGNAGAPSVFVGYGETATERLRRLSSAVVIDLRKQEEARRG